MALGYQELGNLVRHDLFSKDAIKLAGRFFGRLLLVIEGDEALGHVRLGLARMKAAILEPPLNRLDSLGWDPCRQVRGPANQRVWDGHRLPVDLPGRLVNADVVAQALTRLLNPVGP